MYEETSLANSLVSPWGSNNAMVTAQKKSFPLKSSVNVTKSTVSCELGHIYRKKPKWKASFFMCSGLDHSRKDLTVCIIAIKVNDSY